MRKSRAACAIQPAINQPDTSGGKFQVAVVAYGRLPQRRQRPPSGWTERRRAVEQRKPRFGKSPLPSGLPRCARNRATSGIRTGGAFPFPPPERQPQRSLTETAVDRPESRDPSSRALSSRPGRSLLSGSAGACSAAVALTSSAAMAGAGDGRAGPRLLDQSRMDLQGTGLFDFLVDQRVGLVAQPASSEQSKEG